MAQAQAGGTMMQVQVPANVAPGTKIRSKTPYGEIEVTVPPGSKAGDMIPVMVQPTPTAAGYQAPQSVPAKVISGGLAQAAASAPPAPAASAEKPADPAAPKEMIFREKTISVTAEDCCKKDVQKAIDAPKFQLWLKRVEKDKNFDVDSIHFQNIDMFGPTNVGFVKFKLGAKVKGKGIPAIVFMRGGAPAILVVLKNSSDGKLWTLTVQQPRIAVGASSFLEIPAGMLDKEGNLAKVAGKELKEETGLTINEKDLINLSEMAFEDKEKDFQGVYSTCGGSDEYNPIFLYRTTVDDEWIRGMQGKETGVQEEMEQITLKVIPFDKLWRQSADSKALSALCLYNKLQAEGLLEDAF